METLEDFTALLAPGDHAGMRSSNIVGVHFNPSLDNDRYVVGLQVDLRSRTICIKHFSSPYVSSCTPLEVFDAMTRAATFIRATGFEVV